MSFARHRNCAQLTSPPVGDDNEVDLFPRLPLVEILQQLLGDILQAFSDRGGTGRPDLREEGCHIGFRLTSVNFVIDAKRIKSHYEPVYLDFVVPPLAVIKEPDFNTIRVISGGDDGECRQCITRLQQRARNLGTESTRRGEEVSIT